MVEIRPFASEGDGLGVGPRVAADASEGPAAGWWGSNAALAPSSGMSSERYELAAEWCGEPQLTCLTDHCGEGDVPAQPTAPAECLWAQYGPLQPFSEAGHVTALALGHRLVKEVPLLFCSLPEVYERDVSTVMGLYRCCLCSDYLREWWAPWIGGHQPLL